MVDQFQSSIFDDLRNVMPVVKYSSSLNIKLNPCSVDYGKRDKSYMVEEKKISPCFGNRIS